MENCVFCDKNKIKSEVTEVDGCLVFEPINPVVKGHILIVNKKHTKDFTENSEIFSKTCGVASKIAKHIPKDLNLITSKGENATQSIFHCHVHLIPRSENDGLKLPWNK